MLLIPALKSQKQEDLCEFEDSQRTISRDTVSENKNKLAKLKPGDVCLISVPWCLRGKGPTNTTWPVSLKALF